MGCIRWCNGLISSLCQLGHRSAVEWWERELVIKMELPFDIDGIRTPTRLGADIACIAPVHACPLTHPYSQRGRSDAVTKLNYNPCGETVFARVNNNITIIGSLQRKRLYTEQKIRIFQWKVWKMFDYGSLCCWRFNADCVIKIEWLIHGHYTFLKHTWT